MTFEDSILDPLSDKTTSLPNMAFGLKGYIEIVILCDHASANNAENLTFVIT